MSLTVLATTYNGVRYRSRLEARWAIFFDAMGLRVLYEPEGYWLDAGAYLPDFYVPDWRVFIEIKPDEPSDEEQTLAEQLATSAERAVLIALGAPDELHQFIWCDPETGAREGRFLLAQDRMVEAGFWLLAEDKGARAHFPELFGADIWLGDPAKSDKRRGPMLSGALEAARGLARSAKFDRGQMVRKVATLPHEPERQTA